MTLSATHLKLDITESQQDTLAAKWKPRIKKEKTYNQEPILKPYKKVKRRLNLRLSGYKTPFCMVSETKHSFENAYNRGATLSAPGRLC